MSTPRYSFDIHEDHKLTKDYEGVEFATLEEVRIEAQRILPTLAEETLPGDGDRKHMLCL